MRITTAGVAERRPLRSYHDDRAGAFRRGELAAGLATAAIASQLVLAQIVLLAALALVAVGRLSRWRPPWLAVPAFAGVAWLHAASIAVAAAGFDTGSRRLTNFLFDAAVHPGRLAHPAAALTGAGTWLPEQLPLALIAACGEAWLVLWLCWWRRSPGWRWRPGLLALVLRRLSAAALAAGHTATSGGCALGLVVGTGKLAALTWAEATHGVLLAGPDADRLGLAVSCAALRRRKTVVILECARQPAAAGRVRQLAGSLGVPVIDAGPSAAGAGGGPGAGTGAGATGAGAIGRAVGRQAVGSREAIGRAVRSRETVLITTSHADAARVAAADLADVLAGLHDLGLRADCVVWISNGEFLVPETLADLLAVGAATGTVILLGTTSPVHAVTCAQVAGVTVVSGALDAEFALELAASAGKAARGGSGGSGPGAIGHESGSAALSWAAHPISRPIESAPAAHADAVSRSIVRILTSQGAGEFTILAGVRADSGPPRVTANCRAVPITLDLLR